MHAWLTLQHLLILCEEPREAQCAKEQTYYAPRHDHHDQPRFRIVIAPLDEVRIACEVRASVGFVNLVLVQQLVTHILISYGALVDPCIIDTTSEVAWHVLAFTVHLSELN